MRKRVLHYSLLAVLFVLPWSAHAAVFTFSNTSLIDIIDNSVANPYPSTISVSGVAGTVQSVTITLTNFNHTFPADVGALVIGPGGQNVLLFDAPGDGSPVTNLTWIFDDSAASPLPSGSALSGGTFQPGLNAGDTFAGPAPAGPYGLVLSVFNGVDPNGAWSLYIQDFVSPDAGTLDSGWTITITTDAPEPAAWALMGAGLLAIGCWRRKAA